MPDDPRVRVAHCSPDAPGVDLLVDGDTEFETVEFGTVTAYVPVPPGSHVVEFVAGDGASVAGTSISAGADTHYTLLVAGSVASTSVSATLLTDDPGQVPTGLAHVRFVHASADAPMVDVRTAEEQALFERVGFREATGYRPLEAGRHDAELLATGTEETTLRVDGLPLEGGTAVSVFVVGSVADASLDVLLGEDARLAVEADDD